MSRRPNRARQRPEQARPRPVPGPVLDDEYEDDEDFFDGYGPENGALDEDDDEDEFGPAPLVAEDADAFFAAEVSTVRPAVLVFGGREYVLPVRTPLAFSLLAERHADEESLDSFRKVLAPIFGEGTLDEWIDDGMDDRQLSIILMFTAQNMAKPGSATLDDCRRRYTEQQVVGKALNRAQRRAGTGARSSRTGRS